MIKSIKIITCAIVCFSSCTQGKIEVPTIDFQTTEYPIYIGADGINTFYVWAHDLRKPDSILHYHDYQLNRIISVDFYKRKILEHTAIRDEKYSMKRFRQMVSTAEGYIVSSHNSIFKIKESGEVYARINMLEFDNIPFFKDREPGVASQMVGGGLVLNRNFDFIYNLEPSIIDTKLNYLDEPILTKGYFTEKRVENSREGFPYRDFVEEGFTFGHKLGARTMVKGDSVLVDFKFTPNIYIYSVNSLELLDNIKYDELYEDMSTNQPITSISYKENYLTNFSKANLSDQRQYKQLTYDSYRDRFYRIIAEPLENTQGNEYKMLIFDSNLKIIGKLELGEEYIPLLFIMRDGIYIRKLYQRESYIDLVKIDFNIE